MCNIPFSKPIRHLLQGTGNYVAHLNITTVTLRFHKAYTLINHPFATPPPPPFAQRINAHVWKPSALLTQGIRIHYIPLRSSDGLGPTAAEITFRSNVPISLTITSLNWPQWFVTCSNGLTLRGRPTSDTGNSNSRPCGNHERQS